MASVTLEEVKKYLLYEDLEAQDDVIKVLIDAAEAELSLSGVNKFTSSDKEFPLYKLAIQIIVARNFEDRASMEKPGVNLDYIISKLSMSGGGLREGLQQTQE